MSVEWIRLRPFRTALLIVLMVSGGLASFAPAPAPTATVAAETRTEEKRDARAAARCRKQGNTWLPQSEQCTHGIDLPPRGVDPATRPRPRPRRALSAAEAAPACAEPGTNGNRVQVLYGRPENAPSRFDQYEDSFKAWTVNVDRVVRDSAAAAGGGSRQVRFVTDAQCDPVITEVMLPPLTGDGVEAFDGMLARLQSSGYNRTDRKYLVFVDAVSTRACGIGTLYADDRAGPQNWNNTGPSYAAIYAGCWQDSTTATHELMHNLGAVQDTAPHSTRYGHCFDKNDIMCYRDSASSPEMQLVCPEEYFRVRLDCGYDDYFHPAPAPGSYLATHWNTANSQFLVGANSLAAITDANHVAKITRPAAGGTVKPRSRVVITVRATEGAARVQVRVCPGQTCTWAQGKPVGGDTTAPYQIAWRTPEGGKRTLVARVTWNDGESQATRPVTVTVR